MQVARIRWINDDSKTVGETGLCGDVKLILEVYTFINYNGDSLGVVGTSDDSKTVWGDVKLIIEPDLELDLEAGTHFTLR